MLPGAIEVTTVATSAADVERRLVDSLRKDGIAVSEFFGAGWPTSAAPLGAPCYLWFPAATTSEALTAECAALDRDEPRPGVLAIVRAHVVEAALLAGVDDAVSTAISERELVARVRALHRRVRRRAPPGRLRFGALTLDTFERVAWIDGNAVTITPIELAVLVTLLRAGGTALSRAALLDAAWGDGELEVSERAVDNVILRLRRKLPRPEVIETVRGVGFRLAAS